MKFNKLKVGTKFNLILIVTVLFLTISVGFIAKVQIEKAMTAVYTDQVKAVSELGYNWLNEAFPGDWSIKNDELYKGEVKINDNNDFVDQIGEITGSAATIFQGNMRVATNVINENQERSIGTTVDPTVAETVLKSGEVYLGEADILGKNHLTMYQPIKDENENIIGMWFVGPPIETINNMVLSLLTVILVTVLVVGAIAVIFSILFTRSIVHPIKLVNEQLKEITDGEGDLTKEIQVKTEDEIGEMAESFNGMMSSLRSMLRQVSTTSQHVATSSEQLMASSEQTSSATNQVVVSIQEVSNMNDVQGKNTVNSAQAISEITIGMQQIADNISRVAESANDTTNQANLGNENIQKVVDQMSKIYNSSLETIDVMTNLESRSNKIGQIIDVITNIAAQTNLLALNAAIEAARAGEHGKGFAVVADEVRKLAEQSKESANQIVDIIKMIQSDMLVAVDMTNNGNMIAEKGLELAEEAGKSFTQILMSVEGVGSQTQELSAISEEMYASIEQVNEAIMEIAQLAKSTSNYTTEIAAASEEQLATVEEVTASASTLANMAEKLNGLVNKFKL